MRISAGNISAIDTEVRTDFAKQFDVEPTLYQEISNIIKSETSANFYPRLQNLPGLRKWLGARVVHSLSVGEKFVLENETFEETLSISRNDFEDDQFHVLPIGIRSLAKIAKEHPDKLVFDLLNHGHERKGIDGKQYFFDKDHSGFDRNGKETSFSNILRPADFDVPPGQAKLSAGPAWYLFCTTAPFKPFVYQERRAPSLTARTSLNSGPVFERNELQWGVDMRCTAGYGFHNFALRSTCPLNNETLGKAYGMLRKQFRSDGTPYAIKPNILMVPVDLLGTAKKLIEGGITAGIAPDGKTYVSESNIWKGSLKIIDTARLRDEAIDD